jgi:hypothetical protein
MGRPDSYTAEEDAIILNHEDSRKVNLLLKEAGFEERTPGAIKTRRRLLGKRGLNGARHLLVDGRTPSGAMARLLDRRAMLLSEQNRVQTRLAKVNEDLAKAMKDLGKELAT